MAEKGFTTIKITAGDDGKSYAMEIVESEANNGNRIDQKVANWILQLDGRLRDPQAVNMIQQAQQNPQGIMQQMFQRMMGGGGGMMPPMGGGGFNPMMNMFMGGGR